MENFNDLMVEALDDTLKLVLGENISMLINSLAKRQLSMNLNEAGENVDSMISYLEKLIGKEGTQIIQTMSVKRLCHKIRQEYEEVEAHFLFLEELYEMKFKLLAPLLTKKSSANN